MFGSTMKNKFGKHFQVYEYVVVNELKNNLLIFYFFIKFIKRIETKSDRNSNLKNINQICQVIKIKRAWKWKKIHKLFQIK